MLQIYNHKKNREVEFDYRYFVIFTPQIEATLLVSQEQ